MYLNVIYLFLFAYLFNTTVSKSNSNKWVDPNDMSPKYPKEWVDPHDMRPSKEYLKYTSNPSTLHKNPQNSNAATHVQLEMYYKRTINMLLKSVREDMSININIDDNLKMYSGHLHFKINYDDYERLKQYAENTETNIDLFEINRILEEILIKPSHQHIQEFLETWFHKFLNIVFSRQGVIAIVVSCYLYVFYWMIRSKYHLRYMVVFFFINFFIYDLIFTWIHLYQKAEIEQMSNRMKYQEAPIECNPHNMNAWQLFWNNLGTIEDECQKYHQTLLQDIFWKVSPGAVLTDIFARTIEQPSTSIGNAFANICASIYNKFPWPMNIIMFPVIMIFFCLMSMITLSVVFNRNLHFNFLHLFSFSNSVAVGSTRTEAIKDANDRLTDQNVERLLRIAENQQQLIQRQQSRVEEIPLIVEKPKQEAIEASKPVEPIEAKEEEATEETNVD